MVAYWLWNFHTQRWILLLDIVWARLFVDSCPWIMRNRPITKNAKMSVANYHITNPGSMQHSNTEFSSSKNPPNGSSKTSKFCTYSPKNPRFVKIGQKKPKNYKTQYYGQLTNNYFISLEPFLSSYVFVWLPVSLNVFLDSTSKQKTKIKNVTFRLANSFGNSLFQLSSI